MHVSHLPPWQWRLSDSLRTTPPLSLQIRVVDGYHMRLWSTCHRNRSIAIGSCSCAGPGPLLGGLPPFSSSFTAAQQPAKMPRGRAAGIPSVAVTVSRAIDPRFETNIGAPCCLPDADETNALVQSHTASTCAHLHALMTRAAQEPESVRELNRKGDKAVPMHRYLHRLCAT